MPNQTNYAQQLSNLTIGEDVFRFSTPDSYIINNIYSGGFIGLDLDREFIELHLYDQNTTTLVKSVAIPLSEGYLAVLDESESDNIKLQLQFWKPGSESNPDAGSNSLLVKYLNDVPAGVYDIVINFFSDELGTYDDRKWRISEISNSRTEVIIEYDPNREIDLNEVSQFIDTSIFVIDFQKYLTTNFENYQEYYNDIRSILTSQQNVAMMNSGGDVFGSIEILLNVIHTRIDEWIDNEIINKRFRITEPKFNQEIFDIVQLTVSEYINSFPTQDGNDSGEISLMVNE